MELTPAEGRVLGCLIEAAAAAPDAYPVTLNALRLSCNRTEGRHPVVAFDDRTVEDTLLALKSKGLARFVGPRPGERGVRYSHRADVRWRLDDAELAVLAMLLVAGPLTLDGVHALAGRLHPLASPGEVEAVLDTLAARTPRPFAARLDSLAAGPRARWAEALTGEAERLAELAAGFPPAFDPAHPGRSPSDAGRPEPPAVLSPAVPVGNGAPTYAELAARVAELERRLAAATAAPATVRPSPPASRSLPMPAGAADDQTSPAGLAERVADIERRLSRIEAELGALR